MVILAYIASIVLICALITSSVTKWNIAKEKLSILEGLKNDKHRK